MQAENSGNGRTRDSPLQTRVGAGTENNYRCWKDLFDG